MSNAVFPVTPDLPIIKRSMFNTVVQQAASGREKRLGLMTYPLYEFDLAWETLTDDEGRAILGFFNSRGGSYETFRLDDPTDNLVTGQQLGMGNGSEIHYQLIRSYGGFIEPMMEIKASPVPKIYLDEVLKETPADYSINGAGLVTFTSPPGAGVVITADFGFYYRVRFKEDQCELEYFAYQLWKQRQLTLASVKP